MKKLAETHCYASLQQIHSQTDASTGAAHGLGMSRVAFTLSYDFFTV
ncbi:MAG: hypothetical protein E3K37_11235 [Candidatus Kuenenia sp.]|nr:hypothetical protein [Candidatus Kuenenia hertensis]